MIHHILFPDPAEYDFCEIAIVKNHTEFGKLDRKRRSV